MVLDVQHATAQQPPQRIGRWSPRRLGRPAPVRWAARHHVGRRLALAVLALIGAAGGLLIGGRTEHQVGPVDVSFHLRLGGGHTRIYVPPLGTLRIADHGGPLQLDATVLQVRPEAVRQLAAGYPKDVETLEASVAGDVQDALVRLAVQAIVAALLGAALLAALAHRRLRGILGAVGVAAVSIVGVGGYTAATFRPQAIAEPRFTGLLASAPAAFGDVRDLQERFTAYRAEIGKLVGNMSKLYGVTAGLPAPAADGDTIRVLWVSDIHDNPEAFTLISSVSKQFDVDAVVDSGDISDHGTAWENGLYRPIRDLGVPYVFVKGNHDSAVTVRAMERMPNVVVLDGNTRTVAGLAMTGIADPLFTPDQVYAEQQATDLLHATGSRLAGDIAAERPRADLAVVHDPVMADPLYGHVPLVLAGHLHHRDHAYRDGTLLLVQGSTGGAGLRTFDNGGPLPLDLSVLYFSRSTHQLIAYDDITVGGLGLTSAQIDRHAVDEVEAHSPEDVPAPDPSQPSPSSAPASSAPPSASSSASSSP